MEDDAQWFASREDVCGNLTPLSNSNNGERMVGEALPALGRSCPSLGSRHSPLIG